MTSMISDEPKKILMKAAGKPAITISIALRNTWPYRTRASDKPLAFAVVTYCLLISSIKLFLVNSVRVAKLAIVVAITGNVMCHR